MNRRYSTYLTVWIIWFLMPTSVIAMSFAEDTIAPVIINPASNQEVPCNTPLDIEEQLALWYNNHGGLLAEDETSDTIIYTASLELDSVIQIFNSSNGCGNSKRVVVQFFAEDDCQNKTEASGASFNLVDDISPMIITHASPKMVSCSPNVADSLEIWINTIGDAVAEDECSDFVDWFRFTYNDNVGNAGVGFIGLNVIPIPANICNWRVDVSFIVVDECGNQGVTTSYFEIIDDVSPVIENAPPDTLVGCEALPFSNDIDVVDYCTTTPIITYSEIEMRDGTEEDCSYYNYTISRTWEVEDFCGNVSSHNQLVNVVDTLPPSFFIIDTVMIDCSEVDDPEADYLPSNIIDNCSRVITSIVDSIVGENCSYTIDREYTFSDVCGNSIIARQHIIVSDNSPPLLIQPPLDLNIVCGSAIISSFENWYSSFGGAIVEEACGSFSSFAAVPGSYDVSDPATYPGESPGSLDNLGCGGIDGFLFFEEVDFVFYDQCGNVTVSTASYNIIDNQPPVIEMCFDDVMIEVDSGQCSVLFPLPEINYTDNCIETQGELIRTTTQLITSQDSGNENQIVDPIQIEFRDILTDFLQIEGDAQLTIEILRADIDEPDEIFTIVSEFNDTLGFTSNSSIQCGNNIDTITVPLSIIEKIIADGDLLFILLPKSTDVPSESVNDICSNSSIEATISIPLNIGNIENKAILVDGFELQESSIIDNSISLDIGNHTIEYIVKDCANNSDTCSFLVNVIDSEPPTLICPGDTVFLVNGDSCNIDINLGLDLLTIDDNCALNREYNNELPFTDQGSLLNFSLDENSQELIAQNVLLAFEDAFAIMISEMGATLEVTVNANISSELQTIEVKGEDGSTIGILNDQNTLPCQLSRVEFNIQKQQFNSWVEDSIVEISFLPSVGDNGIQGCEEISESGPDGQSLLKARLKYSDANLSFGVNGATDIDFSNFASLENISFNGNVGLNTVTLLTEDAGGNESSCSFEIEVMDNINPKALCKNAVVFLDASGIDDTVLLPQDIDSGSSDNCSIDSMAVVPSIFNCSQLGEEIDVKLEVFDIAGNVDSCNATIILRTQVLEPSFEIGICDNDTLRLIANTPPSSVEDAFTFLWTGPNFTSVLENPVITNASPVNNGTYILEITGFDDCVSTGTVEVNVEQLSSPVITTEESDICIGDDVLLTASGQTGNVAYNWYEGIYPNGLLVESTQAPNLLVTPSSGDHFYYLVVVKDGCESNPSPAKQISVVSAPAVSVLDEFVTVCEGDILVIGTEVNGEGYTYQWFGPGGFTSDMQFPDSIFNVGSSNEGIYRLVISQGSCHSDTASLQVTLFEKPSRPEIIGGDVFCEGSSISLSVNNIPNADLYTWFIDGVQSSTSTSNTLVINNSSEELSGDWTVIVSEGQCNSDESPVKEITIESELLISANNDGPACEGDSIQLSVSFVPGASYVWNGPQGFTSTVQNPKILAVNGEYFVTVTTPSGCDGESTTSIEVLTPPEITALSSDAFECMDGSTDITLFPSVFPQGDYEFIWSGPGEYTSSDNNATITEATESDNGIYSLIVSNGQCNSEERTIEIDITIIPKQPSIAGESQYCVDDSLVLTAISEMEGSRYLWGTPQGQRFTEDPILVIPMIEKVDMGAYSVAVLKGNCRSTASDPLNVEVESLPFPPSISSNAPICPGDSLQLFATAFRDASYAWSGPQGFNSDQQNPVIENVTSKDAGQYSVVVTLGSCTEESPTLDIELKSSPLKPASAEEDYSICSSAISEGLEICIDQQTTQSGNEYFIYNNANDVLLGNSSSICIQLSDLSGLQQGSNFVYIIAEGPECSSESSDLVRIDITPPPIIDAEVEENPIYICNTDVASISSLFGPPDVTVNWQALSDGLVLSSNEGKEIEVTSLNKGLNAVRLTYSSEICPDFSSDTVNIILDDAPIARNDNYSLSTSAPVVLDVFDNDFVPASAQVNITQQPQFGEVEVLETGIRIIPSPAFIGNTSFTYEICGIACEGLCAKATVMLNLGDAQNCVAPTIFTPNGDGINDSFIIPCLYSGLYPNSKIQVYNQWGSVVFKAENYDNTWEGTYNGKPLPVGTYYYIVTLDEVSEKIIGFLILER